MLRLIFAPVRLVFKILSAFLTLILLYFAVTFGQIWMTSHEHSTGSAQAILVFGTTADGLTPSPELAARLDDALQVFHTHRAPLIVVTGGKRPGDLETEAQVSATYLKSHGVPARDIIEGSGADTWQNVTSVITALRTRHIVHVITVTDPFHEYRAVAIASAQGLSAVPTPVENSPTSKYSLWRYYLKETLDVGVGRIIGYGTLSHWTTSHGVTLPFGG